MVRLWWFWVGVGGAVGSLKSRRVKGVRSLLIRELENVRGRFRFIGLEYRSESLARPSRGRRRRIEWCRGERARLHRIGALRISCASRHHLCLTLRSPFKPSRSPVMADILTQLQTCLDQVSSARSRTIRLDRPSDRNSLQLNSTQHSATSQPTTIIPPPYHLQTSPTPHQP